MAIPKSAKTTAVALACAGTAIVAPALAPVLAGAKELFGGVLPAMFGEDGLGKVTLSAIAGFATELFGSAYEKLPEAWSKEHNYDLEKALATAYLESLEHLGSETKSAELKEQFAPFLRLWKSRISRALAGETVSFLFVKQINDGGFTPCQFILDLAEPGKAETLLADDVRHILQRWANEEMTYEQSGDFQQLGLSTSVPLPESLLAFLCAELPPEVSHRFGQVVRRPDFNRSWIAFQQAHLLAINLGLRQFDASNQKLIEKVDALAAQRQFPEMLAEELAEFLSRARDQAAVREQHVKQIVERLRGLEQRLVGEIQQSKDEIKTDLRQVGEELKEEIRKQKNRTAVAPAHQLPAPKPDFTGRRAELDELKAHLRHDDQRGVAIVGAQGMGGVGKTELAVKLAAELKDEYPDAQIFLDLRGVSERPVTSEQALEFAIRSLDPQLMGRLPEASGELQSLYRALLDGKRALLVWDNARDAAQVEPLIPPDGCAMIVTSRERFVLPGMQRIDLTAMSLEEARELLLTIAPRISDQANTLAELCGYLPLALRLTASLLAVRQYLRLADYLHSLEDERQRLIRIDRYAPESGVEAAFSLSYELLGPELQQRWRMLAVFPATFDVAAGAAVWEIDMESAQDVLGDLYTYSLVEWDEITGRWRLHDLARIFANARLSNTEQIEGSERHTEHYKVVLGTAKDLYLKGAESLRSGLALFDVEWDNIRAGWAWVENQIEENVKAAELCIEYPVAGAYVLELRLHPREHIRWLELQMTAARRLKQRYSEGFALGGLGVAHARLGETHKAIECYEQRLVIAREMGDQQGEAAMLGNLGIEYKNLGETHKAIEFYEQALVIDREIGDRRSEGNDLGNLGFAYACLGETRKAIEFYEQALIIDRKVGNRRSEGNVLGNLGLAYVDLGEARKAIEYYEQRLVVAREIDDRRGEGNGLFNLALALNKLGDCVQAIECAEASLRILEEIESPYAVEVRTKLAEWRGQS